MYHDNFLTHINEKALIINILFKTVLNSSPDHISVSRIFKFQTWPQGYKTFFMLNSVEHEILNAHKYKSIKKFGFFLRLISA